MPALKLTSLASYKAYFQNIALKHKQIAGFKWGDADVVRNDNRSDITQNFLWVLPYESSRYADNFSDNVMKTKQARIAFMKVRTSEKFSDQDADFEHCEEIVEQIMTRMVKDKRGADKEGVWEMILTSISSATGGPVEKIFGGTKYIGWELKINFQDNTRLQYDETKWDA